MPSAAAIISGVVQKEQTVFDWGRLAIASALVTLAIVCWEELWFRGIALELAGNHYSKVGAALLFGLLFLCLHFLNPQINLVKHGLELFLAGYALSAAYFLFGGIWAPIGMHYANNMVGSILNEGAQNPIENHLIIYTIALAIMAIVLTAFLLRKTAGLT